jgi:hypothetical protein
LQRVGAEFFLSREILRTFDEVHLAERPLTVEGEMVAGLEGEEQTAVREFLVWALEVCQASGHAEVHEHPSAAVELYKEVFAVATGGLEDVPFRVRCSLWAETPPRIFSLRTSTD